MKVLHVISGLDNGGAEGALWRHAIASDGVVQNVVSLTDGGVYAGRLASAGIPVYSLGMPRGRLTIRAVVALYRLLRQFRPDVVQTWMYHADLVGGVVARCAAVSGVVWGIRGPFDKRRTSRSTRITVYLCALLSRWIPSAIVSNSAHATAVHIRAGYAGRKFTTIPNGYSLEQFHPEESAAARLRGELGLEPGQVLVGMVARFDPHKDHENLFRALRVVLAHGFKFTCLLVGSGMDHDNKPLAGLLQKHGIQDVVRLLGPRDDVADVMAALDVHLLSSAAESFPNVLAEAMACGTPCVTTEVGDAASIVGDTGWLVPSSDHAALARALQEALVESKDLAAWSRRKARCRARVAENYGLDRMVRSYMGVWSSAIRDRQDGDRSHA